MHIFSWLRALNCTKPNWYGKWKYNLAALWLDLALFWLDWEVSSGFNEASFNFLLLPNDFHALVFSHCLHFLLADFQLVSKAKKSLITAATPPLSCTSFQLCHAKLAKREIVKQLFNGERLIRDLRTRLRPRDPSNLRQTGHSGPTRQMGCHASLWGRVIKLFMGN